jgi:hypothetical protein
MKLFKKIDCLALGQFQEGHMSEKGNSGPGSMKFLIII